MAGAEALIAGMSWQWVAGGVAALVVAFLLLSQMIRYRLSRHEFEVLLGNVVIRRVNLFNIDAVYVGGRFPCEFWPSRSVFRSKRLTIRRKRGFPRHLTITPPDPEQLRINLCYALGWKP
ncbi:MAG: hypothetical protein IT580_02255 [Verrucomicrobiales bacterium]|nr:hypothetical protein [Verrucomicrobiales bacterium]